jgi:hypothetical protein
MQCLQMQRKVHICKSVVTYCMHLVALCSELHVHMQGTTQLCTAPYCTSAMQHHLVFAFPDETSEYRIPKKTHTMTSVVILDPADENVNEAANARRQARKANAQAQRTGDPELEKSKLNPSNFILQMQISVLGIRITNSKREKVCLPKSIFLGAFLFLTCLAFAQAIAVGIIISRQCLVKKTA